MQYKVDEILYSEYLKSLYPSNFDFSILQYEQNQRAFTLEKTLNLTSSKNWEDILYHHRRAGLI